MGDTEKKITGRDGKQKNLEDYYNKIDERKLMELAKNLNVDNYSDEELLQHINLKEPYTKTELAEKIGQIKGMFGNNSGPFSVKFLEFYDKVEERLIERIEDDDDDDDEKQILPEIKVKTIKKRHTLIINSDKRTDRTQSTSSFSWQLEDEIANVKKLTIESYNIPKSWYNISNEIGNNIFGISYEQPIIFNFTVRNESDLNTLFNAKSPKNTIYTGSSFDNWMNRNDCTTPSLGAGLIRDNNGKPKTEFGEHWEDISWNVTYDNGNNKFDISTNPNDTKNLLDVSYLVMPPGSTYNYILIRDISYVTGTVEVINDNNKGELTERNLYFLIKQSTIDSKTDISGEIVTFLNNRKPIDFSAVNTDIYSRANLDITNTQDYNEFINSIQLNAETYVPSNNIKEKTYDIWASFKEVDFNGSDNLNITTNLLESEIQGDIFSDISDVSWNIMNSGISSAINVDAGYFYTAVCVKTGSTNIQVKFVPTAQNVKRLGRNFYFRIKEGHYGSVNSLLSAINEAAPKKHYDNRDLSGSMSIKDYVIDTAVHNLGGISIGNANSSHDLITKAYNNDFGTSLFNTIDWNFDRDDVTEHVVLKSLTGDGISDISFILYDTYFSDMFNGITGCLINRDKTAFEKKNSLGKILGYTNDIESNTNNIISVGAHATNSPDLRRVRNINIMLVDYKAYAYVPNSNQINPAPKNVALKTPGYLSEVIFDTSCTELGGAFIEETFINPSVTMQAGSRNLTEKQIYSLNAIYESQEKVKESNEKVRNYRYKDYFLYGIHVRDKPELGSSSNEGILSVYDSKKGKREYIDPTRLTKFWIELVDQNFNLIDFNGIDIELTLNIETEVFVDK